ncbi:hypothetical protein BGZ76_008779 [Entomortierella beljakovae]|nr:hypothetical protein BGZ76_008779 [Entomortierella beljakovae]
MYNNPSTTINIGDQVDQKCLDTASSASSEATEISHDERFMSNSYPEKSIISPQYETMDNVPSPSASSAASSISDRTRNEEEEEQDNIQHRHPPKVRRSIYTRFFRLDLPQTQSNVIVKSSWLPTGALFSFRLVMFLYALTILVADMCLTERIKYEFCYLTQLSYTGLTAYLGTTSWHTFSEWRRQRALRATSDKEKANPTSITEDTLITRTTSIERQHWLLTDMIFFLYHTVCTFHVIVPILYWGYLGYSGDAKDMAFGIPQNARWRNYSFHGGDLVLVLMEFAVNTMPFIPSHIIIVYIICLLYLGQAFVVHHVDGFWIYPFLDTSVGPIWVAYYAAVGFAILLAFFFMFFLHWFRNKQIAKSQLKKQQKQQQQQVSGSTLQQPQDQCLDSHGDGAFDLSQSTIEIFLNHEEMNEINNNSLDGGKGLSSLNVDNPDGEKFPSRHRIRTYSVSSSVSTASTLVGSDECRSKHQEKDRPLFRRGSKRSSTRSDVPPTILEIEQPQRELEQQEQSEAEQSVNSERLEVVHEGNEAEFNHSEEARSH